MAHAAAGLHLPDVVHAQMVPGADGVTLQQAREQDQRGQKQHQELATHDAEYRP